MRNVGTIGSLATRGATSASAATPRHWHNAPVSLNEDHSLAIKGGNVVGEDPDARVRFELQRDNPYY